jgi:hypothetical protein
MFHLRDGVIRRTQVEPHVRINLIAISAWSWAPHSRVEPHGVFGKSPSLCVMVCIHHRHFPLATLLDFGRRSTAVCDNSDSNHPTRKFYRKQQKSSGLAPGVQEGQTSGASDEPAHRETLARAEPHQKGNQRKAFPGFAALPSTNREGRCSKTNPGIRCFAARLCGNFRHSAAKSQKPSKKPMISRYFLPHFCGNACGKIQGGAARHFWVAALFAGMAAARLRQTPKKCTPIC